MAETYFYATGNIVSHTPKLEIVFDSLIPLPIVTWKRPRVVARGTMSGIRVKMINDKKYNAMKANLGWEIKARAPKLRPSEHDRFGFRFVLRLAGPRGGDGDRYENLVMDALQGIVWMDDNQVDEGQWLKTYCQAQPGLMLTIWKFA
ncbi:MAG TPA: RusA family crossover junction endodeoxyribonuclease [Xanthobacteraceae bacterium]